MTLDSSRSAGSAAVAIWRVSHVMGMWWTAAHRAVASPSVSSGVTRRGISGCLIGPPWMCLSGGHPGGRASLGSGHQMDGGTERHLYGSVSQECIPSGTCTAVSFPSGF